MRREFCSCEKGYEYTSIQAGFALPLVKKVPCSILRNTLLAIGTNPAESVVAKVPFAILALLVPSSDFQKSGHSNLSSSQSLNNQCKKLDVEVKHQLKKIFFVLTVYSKFWLLVDVNTKMSGLLTIMN